MCCEGHDEELRCFFAGDAQLSEFLRKSLDYKGKLYSGMNRRAQRIFWESVHLWKELHPGKPVTESALALIIADASQKIFSIFLEEASLAQTIKEEPCEGKIG